jgi:large subunit ribosomal protein L25
MATSVDEPLKLRERSVLRKGLTSLRQEGLIPAVIHNHGQPSIHVMAPETELVKIYRLAGKHHPLQLEVGSQDFLALIKDVHYNPVKRRMQHVVFQAIKRDEKVEAEVPIHLEGEIPAEKIGLQVIHQLDHVEVEALPVNLPDQLKIDVTGLAEIGDKVTVADLAVPEGVTILTDTEHPIASIVEPKEQIVDVVEPVAEEPEEGEAQEGETEEGQSAEGTEAEAAGEQLAKKEQ